MTGPYAASAMVYLTRGVGGPLPIPAGQKYPPPTGWTGYDAPWPGGPDVTEWASNGKGIGNVCLRLVETVIGIDVDAYGSKPGLETLREAEARLGPLPDTYVSTSRPLPSGIRFYRVPPGRVWADVVGPGVEIIHYGHRYAVVAPSVHPDTGDRYAWLLGGAVVPGPALGDLVDFPAAWVAEYDRGPIEDRSKKASVTALETVVMLAEFPVGPMCQWIESVLSDASAELGSAVSRHDTVRRFIAILVRAGEQGHVGAVDALERLETVWEVALRQGESRAPDHGEWERMVAGAVAIVTESPTLDADKGCCGTGGTDVDLSFDPGVSDALDQFWGSREVLSHIHTYARAQVVSPWAVLGVVLARMVTRVRHDVVLPKIIGSWGSLNLFVALVGDSGVGKGAAEGVATDAVRFGQHIDTVTVGSGEGICHFYAHREKQDVIRDKFSCLFTVPEVDTLSALSGRTGATLLPELRKAFSGEQLGMLYADPSKRLPIERHTYRLCLVLGVQPLRAGGLLADTGGTPQRFVWLPASDPHLPDVPPETPSPWTWPGIEGTPFGNPDGVQPMTVCDEAVSVILENRRARMRGNTEALDGHALFCRLKVAAAFALLDSRWEVTESDWSLAGTVMSVSSRTRDAIQARITQAAIDSDKARAIREGDREVIRVERVEGAVAGRCREKVLGLLGTDDWTAYRDLHNGVSRPQREHLEPVLAELLGNGLIERKDGEDREWFRLRKQV